MYNKLFAEIQNYRVQNKLVFFVGAGVSRVSNYPSWASLVEAMAKELKYPYNSLCIPAFSSDELLKIPQMYFDKYHSKKYITKVREGFSGDFEINEVHKNIMRLHPHHLITTNYDTLLEQAAMQFGINYSVINGDENVSFAETQSYILKVHGDFQAERFVLKEDDYINYSDDYKLIDNVLKTVLATNLIVFIGYGLNDVNIKSIINWVKKVQGNTYINPMFINTDKKSSKEDITYYSKKGIRIIDACKFYNGDDYKMKYNEPLKSMLNYTEINHKDYLFELTKEWRQFYYITNSHIELLLNRKYKFDYGNNLFNACGGSVNFIEELYADSSSNEKEKKKQILDILRVTNITGVMPTGKLYQYIPKNEFSNKAFWGYYDEIDKYLNNLMLEKSSVTCSSDEWYEIAYQMFICGHYIQSYDLYTKAIALFYSEKKWIKYYFCQINRYFVYKAMLGIKGISSGFQGMVNYGKQLNLFDDEISDSIYEDMSGFRYDDLFAQLPGEIKNKYDFLRKYCTQNIYADDIIKTSNMIYQIKIDISKNTQTIIGFSEYDKLIIHMTDALRFTYDNMLLFTVFSEHKKYVENALTAYIEGKSNESSISGNKHLENITAQDLLLVNKCFDKKSIMYLYSKNIINTLVLDDAELNRYSNYVNRMINYYKDNFYGEISGDKIVMYTSLNLEYMNLSVISSLFLKTINDKLLLIEFIINYMLRTDLDFLEKLSCIRLSFCDEISDKIVSMAETMICKNIDEVIKYPAILKSDNDRRLNLHLWCDYIKELKADYISQALSDSVVNSNFDYEIKQFLSGFKKILNNEAVSKL